MYTAGGANDESRITSGIRVSLQQVSGAGKLRARRERSTGTRPTPGNLVTPKSAAILLPLPVRREEGWGEGSSLHTENMAIDRPPNLTEPSPPPYKDPAQDVPLGLFPVELESSAQTGMNRPP